MSISSNGEFDHPPWWVQLMHEGRTPFFALIICTQGTCSPLECGGHRCADSARVRNFVRRGLCGHLCWLKSSPPTWRQGSCVCEVQFSNCSVWAPGKRPVLPSTSLTSGYFSQTFSVVSSSKIVS